MVYYDPYPNKGLEEYLAEYSTLQQHYGQPAISVKRVETVEEVLKEADVRDRLATPSPTHTSPCLLTTVSSAKEKVNSAC